MIALYFYARKKSTEGSDGRADANRVLSIGAVRLSGRSSG